MLKTAPKKRYHRVDRHIHFNGCLLILSFAIEIGMVIACLLFIKRMSEETRVDSWVYVDDDTPEIE